MKMLNFWRSTFDDWLNSLAEDAGADFRDNTSLIDFVEDKSEGKIIVKILAEGKPKEVKARYLIGADGMLSRVRRRLRPQDFNGKAFRSLKLLKQQRLKTTFCCKPCSNRTRHPTTHNHYIILIQPRITQSVS